MGPRRPDQKKRKKDIKMGLNYNLGGWNHTPVDKNKKLEDSDDETESEVSEPSIGIKDPPYELNNKTMNNMD